MTTSYTRDERKAHIWAILDHCTGECLGIHASKSANRFQALKPVRQAVSRIYGGYTKIICEGLLLRHDHGSQYTSNDFQKGLSFLGIQSSASFMRTPEGDGVIEHFFRTLKNNCLWKESFQNIESLEKRLHAFREDFNKHWIMHRHGYKTPHQVRMGDEKASCCLRGSSFRVVLQKIQKFLVRKISNLVLFWISVNYKRSHKGTNQ